MRIDSGKLMCECPTVVGMLTSSLESGGSLDTAVRNMACNGPPLSRRIFADAVHLTDTKVHPDVGTAVSEGLSELPEGCSGYRRAVSMCIAASESSDRGEMSRMLRDAADSSLESVRILGETYGSSLNFPVSAIFGIGIMVPMTLMSLMPMLGVGGVFGADTIDGRVMVLVTLVVIPLGILAMCLHLRSSNPFHSTDTYGGVWRSMLPLTISIPLMMFHSLMGWEPEGILLFSLGPAAVVTLVLNLGVHSVEKRRRVCIDEMMDSITDLGNRMLSGENYTGAVVGSIKGRPHCSEFVEAVERGIDLCRGDVPSAVSAVISPVSEEISLSLRDIHSCSEDDIEDAGRLAVTLGRQYQNRMVTLREVESKLKSMTDMMYATAAFFAPMVLGLSVAMLEPLSDIAGGMGMEDTSLVLSLYLVELDALISLLTACLGRDVGYSEIVWRFCLMCPVSLLVFAVCRGITL